MKNRKAKKGFTIIELVIVIAVIGILAAVLIPTFSNVIDKANATAAMEEARNAYTQYLLETADKNDVANYNFNIKVTKSGTDYYFAVTNGQFGATQLTITPTENIYTVTETGSLLKPTTSSTTGNSTTGE